jgi:hypothetical protein
MENGAASHLELSIRWFSFSLLLLASALSACSSGVDDVLEAWKEAGESPSAFTDMGEKLPGGKCQSGTILARRIRAAGA